MTLPHALEIYNKANGSTITEDDLDSEMHPVDLAACRAIQEVWGYSVNLQDNPRGIQSTQILALVIWQAKEKARDTLKF